MALEIDLGRRWLGLPRFKFGWPGVFKMVVDSIDEAATEFVWRQGRNLISLTRAGDSWTVQYQTASRLIGPRHCVYQATHRTAKFAAWDVMARVIGACHDEDEGLQVALRAAQWMRRSDSMARSEAGA